MIATVILFVEAQLYTLASENNTYLEGHHTSRFFLKYQKYKNIN